MNSYDSVLTYLYEQLPAYQRKGPAAYKNSLDNTLALDLMFDHPHKCYKTIHVGGTNGKGSVSHMMASVLQHAGYKVGLYTSPHLKDFRERIKVNGKMIGEEEVVQFVNDFRIKNEKQNIEPSFFELTVAMAFDYFRMMKVDVAIIEVGLGGRLDSTNIIQPELSIITNIGLDHTALLGETLEAIAEEKAGIIKSGRPVVVGLKQKETMLIFRKKAEEVCATLLFADDFAALSQSYLTISGKQLCSYVGEINYDKIELDLLGNYQRYNLRTVLVAIEQLKKIGWKIDENAIRSGISAVVETTGLLGRWQLLGVNPKIVCDTGHNVDGIKEVIEQIRITPHKNLHMIIGVVNDKNIDGVLRLLPKEGIYYFTQAQLPRALDRKELQMKAKDYGLIGECFQKVEEAFKIAKKNADVNDLIFIGGSTFVVAEVL